MKLDSSRAWQEAVSAVMANKEVVLALAGVFFLLPSLAFALFFPQPDPPANLPPEAMIKLVQAYYISVLPFALPMAVVQMIGSLAIVTLFTDRTRPTVGQAIKQGAIGLLPYIGASLLLGMAIGVIGGIVAAAALATGSKLLAVLVFTVLIVVMIYIGIRLSLIAPVVAVERVRNPVTVLSRSWALTQGNAGRILLFMLLVLIVFLLAAAIIMGVAGIVLVLALGASAAKIASAVLSSFVGAIVSTYFLAINAAIHRQLAGPSADIVSATFD